MDENPKTQDASVADFFAGYARALSAVDLDELADSYVYPSLAVSRAGTQAITDAEMTRGFFAENAKRYTSAGIHSVRIGNLRPSYSEDGLWVGLADLENLDESGHHMGSELNAYQLVRIGDRWAIAVTSPLYAPA